MSKKRQQILDLYRFLDEGNRRQIANYLALPIEAVNSVINNKQKEKYETK